MVTACPISSNRVDANLVRVSAFFVASLAVAFLISGNVAFLVILFLDFAIRFARKQKFSLIYLMSQYILNKLNLEKRPCDEAPKRFALTLGLVISFLMLFFYLTSLTYITYALSTILIICAVLEVAFEYCIGCEIYKYLQFAKKLVK